MTKHAGRLIALGSILVMLLAACGKNTAATVATSSSTAVTSSSAKARVKPIVIAIDARVLPKLGTVLVNAQGFTLYVNLQEKGGRIACTGQCARTWPPVALPAGAKSTAGTGVNASLLGAVSLSGGTREITYNKWPLHTFAGDTKPGQTNGQGIGGIWFAITTTGQADRPSSPKAATTSSSTPKATTSPKTTSTPKTTPTPTHKPTPKPSPTPTCLNPPYCY